MFFIAKGACDAAEIDAYVTQESCEEAGKVWLDFMGGKNYKPDSVYPESGALSMDELLKDVAP